MPEQNHDGIRMLLAVGILEAYTLLFSYPTESPGMARPLG